MLHLREPLVFCRIRVQHSAAAALRNTMNLFTIGFNEVRRKLRRQRSRIELAARRRDLARLEIELGRHSAPGLEAEEHPPLATPLSIIASLIEAQNEITKKEEHLENDRTRLREDLAEALRQTETEVAALEKELSPIIENRDRTKALAREQETQLGVISKELRHLQIEQTRLGKEIQTLALSDAPDAPEKRAALTDRLNLIPDEIGALDTQEGKHQSTLRPLQDQLRQIVGVIDGIDTRISGTRSQFHNKEKESTQQLKDLDQQSAQLKKEDHEHEKQKEEPWRIIGHHLLQKKIVPENRKGILQDAERLEAQITLVEEQLRQLSEASAGVNLQDLRKFYFVVGSIIALALLILFFVFRSPPDREWLPEETYAIFSLNVTRLPDTTQAATLGFQDVERWGELREGLVGSADVLETLGLRIPIERITSAVGIPDDGDEPQRYLMAEMAGSFQKPVAAVIQDLPGYKRNLRGITIVQNNDNALAAIGPTTFAFGAPESVDSLVRVRLGLQPDLDIDEQFFAKFIRLDEGSTIRFVLRDPQRLEPWLAPIFGARLQEASHLFGASIRLEEGLPVRLLIQCASDAAAKTIQKEMLKNPGQWFGVGKHQLPLFKGDLDIRRRGVDIEVRFSADPAGLQSLLQHMIDQQNPLTLEM